MSDAALDMLRVRPAVVLNCGMPVTPGLAAVLTELLDGFGFEVEQRDDGPLDDLSADHVVWIGAARTGSRKRCDPSSSGR